MKTALLLLACLSLPGLGYPQQLLPNHQFESGAGQPDGWRLAEGDGEWLPTATAATNRWLHVRGNGEDSGVWRTDPLPLKPGALYALRFRGRRLPGASGGTAVAGTGLVNRDFPLDATWREHGFIFRQPDGATEDFVRLGQWHVKGGVEFDDAELLSVLASHRLVSKVGTEELWLGTDERVLDGTYRFAPDLGWAGAQFHRPLWRSTARFNSDRWVFTPGSEVVYRFDLAGHAQTGGRVRAAINHHVAGTLEVSASHDGDTWVSLGRLDGGDRAGDWALPARLLPATSLLIRLRTPDAETALQVNRFEYETPLRDAAGLSAKGATDFMEVLRSDPAVEVQSFQVVTTRGQGRLQLCLEATLRLTNDAETERELSGPTVRSTPSSRATSRARRDYAVCPVVQADQPGDHELHFVLRAKPDRVLLETRTVARLGHLYDPRAGYRLSAPDGLALWWCESGWKVARTSQPPGPEAPARPVTVTAARGEYEAAQVFLRPEGDLRLLSVKVQATDGRPTPIQVEVNEVAYVQVTRPTDASCQVDWYPDPLPPLFVPWELAGGTVFPLWLTFHVARDAAPGEHTGEALLKLVSGSREFEARVPWVVQVYDFELPRETHLRSALGLGSREVNRYHKLTNRADQIAVFEKYLANFAAHRISPYSFFDYAPIEVRFEGEGTNGRARVDFTQFDAWAARWLDLRGTDDHDRSLSQSPFNSFRLPLRGMGGGTFHSRHLGELEGFAEGTPEHARLFQDYLSQVERHLRDKGWLDEAFTYWFDEPDPKDYEFVVAGQQRIKAAAPGLKRMMTEQPEPELMGHVDIWCALSPEWTPDTVRARGDAGEEVWWYICTGPKAPYVTEFIDHPGTELRLWPWQSWQYGVNGVLIWATLWWHSPTAYPDRLQNPWEDPMSWVSGYGTPAGTRSPWGNGDGRFLYPPRRDPNTAAEPSLEGPINSIRWENLRDGMEDYEYFWLLREAVRGVEASKGGSVNRDEQTDERAALLAEAKRLLTVPDEVSRDLTHFTTDPRPLLEHRERLARMIERLAEHR